MKFNWILTMVAAGSVFVLGCDSGTASSGGGSPTDTVSDTSDTTIPSTLTIDELGAKTVEATCAYLTKCGTDTGFAFVSPDSCALMLAANGMDTSTDDMKQAVASGKVKFDGAKAAECLQSFLNRPCETTDMKEPEACRLAFVGSQVVGTPCSDDVYCASGKCAKPQNKSACGGTCADRKKSGDPCETSDDCEGTLLCAAGFCATQAAPLAAKGESCAKVTCAAGLYCSGGFDGSVCKDLSTEGQPCDFGPQCAGDLSCVSNDGPNVCTKSGKEGDSCTSPSMADTGKDGCAKGLICGTEVTVKGPAMKCQPVRKLGEACVSDFQCGGIDAGCVASKCAILPGKGGACTPSDPMKGKYFVCLPSLVCDPTSLKCDTPPAAGKPCVEGKCADGLVCVEDVCQPLPVKGAACNFECATPFECDNGTCVDPICEV